MLSFIDYQIISKIWVRKIMMNFLLILFWNQVEGLEQCEDYFSEAQFEDSGVNIDLRNQFVPLGFKDKFHRDLSCVNHNQDDFKLVKNFTYVNL